MKENLEERSKRKKKNPFDPLTCFSVSCRELLTRHPLCLLSPSPRNQFRTRRSIGRSIEQRSPNFPLGLLATDSKRLAPRGAPTFREESGRSRRLLFSSISSEEPNTPWTGHAPATPQREQKNDTVPERTWSRIATPTLETYSETGKFIGLREREKKFAKEKSRKLDTRKPSSSCVV